MYLELLGSGLVWSINYDRRTEHNFWLRAGFGYYSWDTTNEPGQFGSAGSMTMFPMAVTKLVGNAGSWFEIGLGTTFIHVDQSQTSVFGLVSGSNARTSASASAYVVSGIIGYRWSPATTGSIFRIGFTPFFFAFDSSTVVRILRPWGGLSLGFAF
ncbi:MAG: hypothetical protein ABJA82_18525 [Myxococcales bacterium]